MNIYTLHCADGAFYIYQQHPLVKVVLVLVVRHSLQKRLMKS